MKYLQKFLSRKFYRSLIFWGLFVTLGYSLAGFLLLPNIINNTIVSQVQQQLGWNTKIEKVEINPFALTLAIHNLQIEDQKGQTQIAFKRYFMNFELRSLIEGAFTFSDIQLANPVINLVLDKERVSNYQHALHQQQKKQPSQPVSPNNSTDSKLVKLLIDNAAVIAGEINITDHGAAKSVKHQLKPISFQIKNLFTYGKNEGEYHLNIALGHGQTINWNGSIGISPFRSTGSLKVSGVRVHKLWDYLSEQMPYHLEHALAKFSGQYQISMANEQTQLKIKNSTISIDDIKLADKQRTKRLADVKTINVGLLDFNLNDNSLQIDSVEIDGMSLQVERNKQGVIDLLAPFEKASENRTTADNSKLASTKNSPFKWSIASLLLSNSELSFADKRPKQNAQISVNKINFNITGLSDDLSQSLPFKLSYYINQSGENRVSGNLTAIPLKLQTEIAINQLTLSMFQPYLNEFAKIDLQQGTLTSNGKLTLSQEAQGKLHGGFQGEIIVSDLTINDPKLQQKLLGWKTLDISPLKVNLNPLMLTVDKVMLNAPYLSLVVDKNRDLNLTQLVVNNATEKPIESKSETSKPLPITIEEILIKDGGTYFADLSLQPQFGTSIENIEGQVSGLSSDNLARANVDIKGTVEEYGKMKIKGKINPLSGDLYTDIAVDFDKIELSSLTPYSGRHAGYEIDKGKLNLHLNYKIANNILDGNNQLILDQFEFGADVKSEEAVNLPLKLALALFKDNAGIVDINLHTKGDMNDPDFAIGGLVMKALANIISKAVTSPFSMAANLVGGDAEKLNSVAFNFGSATLSPDHIEQLKTLAALLNKRPKLVLEIRAIVDPKKDGLAIQKQQLQTLLQESGTNTMAQPKRLTVIEQLLVKSSAENELTALQQSMQDKLQSLDTSSQEAENSAKQLLADEYEQALQQALLTKQPLTSLQLNQLAQQRISTIKAQLIKQGKVANKQVFSLQPSLTGKTDAQTISTIFTLATD